jgi:uncharacterized tellurite resistance protein B-like protein
MDNVEIIHSVVSMLVTDGKIPPQESEFLKRLCQRLGVSSDVVETAFEKFVQGEAYVYLPKDDDEKKRLINYLLEAIVADGKVAPQERTLLEAVAARLGIPQQHFEHTLNMLLRRTSSGMEL